MKWYYVSTESFTGAVAVNEAGYITEYPPILKRFNGQHLSNLRNWITRHRLHIFDEMSEEEVSLKDIPPPSYETS